MGDYKEIEVDRDLSELLMNYFRIPKTLLKPRADIYQAQC